MPAGDVYAVLSGGGGDIVRRRFGHRVGISHGDAHPGTAQHIAVVKAVAKGNDLLSGIPQAVGLGQHGAGLVHAGLRDADHLMALVHEAQPRSGAAQGLHLFRGGVGDEPQQRLVAPAQHRGRLSEQVH